MTPAQMDTTVLRRHLLALRAGLTNLQRHAGCTAAELRGDPDLRWAVERGLQLCAQNAIDIATHIAVSSGLDVPDYASAIDRLAELSVLSQDFAARFRGVAGFRNVLVHGYLDVDLNLIEAILGSRLSEFQHFATAVDTFINSAD